MYKSLEEIRAAMASGSLTVSQVVNHYLQRIEANQGLNAFLEVYAAEAQERAAAIDQKVQKGTAGMLAGMVIGLKDNLCYRGHVASASSKMLQNFTSVYSATVVERLLAEDAIVIGRLNCDEFAMGSSNETSAYGPVRNPLDPTRSPGGSSGGSSAAVAAGLCLVALGSDTGGSIRQPASFTGTFGYKPTYGMVSRFGLIAFASSFDQIGPFTHTPEDAALVMDVIAGKDPQDSTSSSRPTPQFAQAVKQAGGKKKIALLKNALELPGLDPEIRTHLNLAVDRLKAAGHEVVEVDYPYLDYLVPIYYILTTAEASSNLARYDGVHFGYRSPDAVDLESTYKLSRTQGFGTEVKRRILLGTFVLSSGYYDAYFGKAQKARRLVTTTTEQILAEADFILSPTSPHTAFELGKEYDDPTVMYLEDIFTVQANITGMPAVSIPTGTHSNGLPFGLHLTANKFADAELLAFSREVMNIMA